MVATILYYDTVETKIGWMGLLASSNGLRRTTLPKVSEAESIDSLGKEIDGAEFAPDRFCDLKGRLFSYFVLGNETFKEEPVDVSGAGLFFIEAWQACREIPLGQTRTYLWVASRAGKPEAVRAAGQAMAHNRLPIIIPCHRVIASNGMLRGFGGGTGQLKLKYSLLRLEGIRVKDEW